MLHYKNIFTGRPIYLNLTWFKFSDSQLIFHRLNTNVITSSILWEPPVPKSSHKVPLVEFSQWGVLRSGENLNPLFIKPYAETAV